MVQPDYGLHRQISFSPSWSISRGHDKHSISKPGWDSAFSFPNKVKVVISSSSNPHWVKPFFCNYFKIPVLCFESPAAMPLQIFWDCPACWHTHALFFHATIRVSLLKQSPSALKCSTQQYLNHSCPGPSIRMFPVSQSLITSCLYINPAEKQ